MCRERQTVPLPLKRGDEMKQKLVSIIVPMYNAAPYVARCLDSLVAQTYPHTEIIVVDDGSSDESGAIADRYAARYPQVRCVHSEKQGQSAARNRAMRMANGDYYLFVDSDDHIENNMVECLMAACETNAAEIAVGFYWMEYPMIALRRPMLPQRVWNTEEALSLLLDNRRLENFAWGKLFRASLFEGITFPDCRFEDIYAIFQVFARAQRIVTVPQRFYHYTQRRGSITNARGLLVKDAALLNEMRAAFHYQQTQLQRQFPDTVWDAHNNEYMSEMLTLLSLLFVRKEAAAGYTLTPIDLTKQTFSERLCYRTLSAMVRRRFHKEITSKEKEMVSAGNDLS